MSVTVTVKVLVIAELEAPSTPDKVTVVTPLLKEINPLEVPSAMPDAEPVVAPLRLYPHVAPVQLSLTGSAIL